MYLGQPQQHKHDALARAGTRTSTSKPESPFVIEQNQQPHFIISHHDLIVVPCHNKFQNDKVSGQIPSYHVRKAPGRNREETFIHEYILQRRDIRT